MSTNATKWLTATAVTLALAASPALTSAFAAGSDEPSAPASGGK